MKKIRSFSLILIPFIFASLTINAQNFDSWQYTKDQYGKTALSYVASEVNSAKVINGYIQEFKKADINANVLVNYSESSKRNYIFIRLMKDGKISSLEGISISSVKVYAGNDLIYFEENVGKNMDFILLDDESQNYRYLLNKIFSKHGKLPFLTFYIDGWNGYSGLVLEFFIQQIPS